MTRVALDLREVLFQGRGWGRYGMNLVRSLAQRPVDSLAHPLAHPLEFLFVVEDRVEATRRHPFLVTCRGEFLELPLDRRLDSRRAYHPDIDGCDIYHSLTEFPEFVTQHARMIVTIHDTSFRVCPADMDPRFVAAASDALDRSIEEAAAITTTTKWVASSVCEHGIARGIDVRDRVHRTGFGLDHLPSARGSELPCGMERGFLLYVGGVEPDKNVDLVVNTMAERDAVPIDVNFVVVGRDAREFASRIDPRMRSRMILLPDTDDEELVELYAAAAYLVAPSLDEGLGLCPLEALRLGTPCICSDIPPFREHLGETALYFNPRSREGLLAAFRQAFTAGTRGTLLRAADRRSLGAYTWGRCAERTGMVYDLVLR